MNTTITKKMYAVADKVTNSKVYKGAEKVAVGVGSAVTALSTMAVTAFAEDSATSSTLMNAIAGEVNSNKILDNAQPLIVPAIGVMCVVGGIKLGMRFFRHSMS